MLLWTSGSQCIYWEDFIKIHWLQFETTSNPLMCKFEITSSLPIRKKNYFNMNWKNIKSVSFFQNNFIWWKGQKSLFKSSFYKISLNLAYTFMRLDCGTRWPANWSTHLTMGVFILEACCEQIFMVSLPVYVAGNPKHLAKFLKSFSQKVK